MAKVAVTLQVDSEVVAVVAASIKAYQDKAAGTSILLGDALNLGMAIATNYAALAADYKSASDLAYIAQQVLLLVPGETA
jgi:PIN domain nuclease of toxin-antitoxin system